MFKPGTLNAVLLFSEANSGEPYDVIYWPLCLTNQLTALSALIFGSLIICLDFSTAISLFFRRVVAHFPEMGGWVWGVSKLFNNMDNVCK